jgi:hypothetical protein
MRNSETGLISPCHGHYRTCPPLHFPRPRVPACLGLCIWEVSSFNPDCARGALLRPTRAYNCAQLIDCDAYELLQTSADFYRTIFSNLRRLWACGALHYLHLARIIRAIADVLIISGILPNSAIASHLSTNSSDSAAPPCISFTENATTGLTISSRALG